MGHRLAAFLSAAMALAAGSLAQPVQSWVRTRDLGLYDRTAGVAVDSLGNLYIVGDRQTASGTDIVLLKYSNLGTLLWTRIYNGPQGKPDSGYSVATDGQNNVLVAGNIGKNNMSDAVLLKYSASGSLLFARTYSQTEPSLDGFTHVAVDSAANSYVAGTTRRFGSTTALDTVLRKYSPSGAILWTRLFTSAGESNDRPRALVMGPGGTPVVAIASSGGFERTYVLKLNPSTGASTFQKLHGTSSVQAIFGGLSLAPNGDVALCVSERFGETGQRVALMRWAFANGAVLMSPKYWTAGAFGPDYYQILGLASDSTGGVRAWIVAAKYTIGAYQSVARLISMSSAGAVQWERELVPSNQGANYGGLAIDHLQNVYAWATLSTSPRRNRIWKVSQTGVQVWMLELNRPAPRGTQGWQMVRRSNGELFLGGVEFPVLNDQRADFIVYKVTGG